MPQLKQLSCTIQWDETGAPFQEYGTVYGDGIVETFIVVPNKPQPFTIHLKSLRYIHEGLAMVVFVDGDYQSNRNRVNLKPAKNKMPLNQTQVDFLVRQREKPIGEGVYMGRQWRFDYHNIVEHLPEGVKESHFDQLGTIEVLVLRCTARIPEERDESGSSSAADSDTLGTKGKRPVHEQEGSRTKKHPTNDGPLDGDAEELENELAGLLLGLDGTNDDRHPRGFYGAPGPHPEGGSWHTSRNPNTGHYRNHSRHHLPTCAQPHQHLPFRYSSQASHQSASHPLAPQKHVRFDVDAPPPAVPPKVPIPEPSRSQSYERVRNVSNKPPQPNRYRDDPVQRPSYHTQQIPFAAGTHNEAPVYHQFQQNHDQMYQLPAGYHTTPQSMSNSTPAAYLPVFQAPHHTAFHPQMVKNYSATAMQPFWPTLPPHLVYNPYQHPQGTAWSTNYGPHVYPQTMNPSPATLPDSTQGSNPADNSQSSHGTQPRNFNSNTSNAYANWDDTKPGEANNGSHTNWQDKGSSDQNRWNDGGLNNGQNNDTGSGLALQFYQGNDDTNGPDSNVNMNGNNDFHDSPGNGDWSNGDGVTNDNDKGGGWDNNNIMGNGREKEATESGRALFGPHGQYVMCKPRGPDEPAPDAEEEPRYDVPLAIARARSSTKQVLPGSGYMYWKKRRAPDYVDALDEPYARFVFKYRTKDQLEKETGIKIDVDPTGDEAVQELQDLDKQALVEMLVRAKSALGGKIPSPPLKPSSSASGSTPIPVDPPNYGFLNYKLPELRRTVSSMTNTAAHVHDNAFNGNTGGGDSWNGQGSGFNNANSNIEWSKPKGASKQDINWNSTAQFNNPDINWRRESDGTAEPADNCKPAADVPQWTQASKSDQQALRDSIGAAFGVSPGGPQGSMRSSPSTLALGQAYAHGSAHSSVSPPVPPLPSLSGHAFTNGAPSSPPYGRGHSNGSHGSAPSKVPGAFPVPEARSQW